MARKLNWTSTTWSWTCCSILLLCICLGCLPSCLSSGVLEEVDADKDKIDSIYADEGATTEKSASNDNYIIIVAVGAVGLVLLVFIWILLCCCFECLCFRNSEASESSDQRQFANQSQHGGGADDAYAHAAYDNHGVQPWTVMPEQDQRQYYQHQQREPQKQYSSYYEQSGSLPPPLYNPYARPISLLPQNPANTVPVPKPDYYYDNEVSKSPTSEYAPPSSFKLKPVPPPKPAKPFIPQPDY